MKTSRDVRNPLRRYMLKHSRAYAFRTADHWKTTELRVEFAPGYVRLYHPEQGEFYITRNAWIKLLRFAVPLVKHMDEQFSVPRATRKYLQEEKRFNQELKRQKRQMAAEKLARRRRKMRARRLSRRARR